MINVNAPAVNYYLSTPSVALQLLPVVYTGNPGEGKPVTSSHGDISSALDKHALTGSRLLNLSAPMTGGLANLQGMYGTSPHFGLLQRAQVAPGNVFTAYCPPKPQGDNTPTAEPKPDNTKPTAEPKPDNTKPTAEPKPDSTKPTAQPKPTDDTTYGFNSNTGKPETSLTSASDKPEFNVWDERGIDTFDFSGFEQDQIIDLRGGALSSVGGMRENVRIGEKTVIENAVGGRGNDRLMGNSADNVLTGGAGADTLVGGGGWNTFKFNAFSDSTRDKADLLLDFNTGQDKIDLSQMALDGKVAFNFVDAYTGAAGDTIIKFNPHSGRYLLAIDLDGDGKTDFLVKSTRMISPEDVIGLNIKDGGYL